MKSKVPDYFLLAFCFTLPISQLISSRILIVAVIVSLFFTKRKISFSSFLNQSWDLLFFFSILLIGLLYSKDLTVGFRQIETSLSFVGIPIFVYAISDFTKEKLNQACYAFIIGVLAACLICIGYAVFVFYETSNIQAFFYNKLTLPIDSHPTYFAYFLIFAITYLLYTLYYEHMKISAKLVSACVVFLFIILLLTGGQTVFISLLLVFSFFILKYLLGEKSKKETLVVSMVVAMILLMFTTIITFQNNDKLFLVSGQNDYWERMILWESAIHANLNPLFGVGTGDYNDVLNEYYRSHSLAKFAANSFNSHNQFIQIYFSNGVLGLIGFLILLGRPLYLSVKSQNLLGILVFFPFLIYGITEVFLGRYQGVAFFGVLNQIFITHSNFSEPKTY
jgi:O-antigen ligase